MGYLQKIRLFPFLQGMNCDPNCFPPSPRQDGARSQSANAIVDILIVHFGDGLFLNSLSARFGIGWSWPYIHLTLILVIIFCGTFLRDHICTSRPHYITYLNSEIRSHRKYRYRSSKADREKFLSI
jgi:hypothetical protein